MLFHLPYSSKPVHILGAIVYVISLILFVITFLGHIVRFLLAPALLPDSFTHPSEGAAVATFPAALGLLIINGATYGMDWGAHDHTALKVFYWVYVVLTVIGAVLQPAAMFSHTARERARGVSKVFIPAAFCIHPTD